MHMVWDSPWCVVSSLYHSLRETDAAYQDIWLLFSVDHVRSPAFPILRVPIDIALNATSTVQAISAFASRD